MAPGQRDSADELRRKLAELTDIQRRYGEIVSASELEWAVRQLGGYGGLARLRDAVAFYADRCRYLLRVRAAEARDASLRENRRRLERAAPRRYKSRGKAQLMAARR